MYDPDQSGVNIIYHCQSQGDVPHLMACAGCPDCIIETIVQYVRDHLSGFDGGMEDNSTDDTSDTSDRELTRCCLDAQNALERALVAHHGTTGFLSGSSSNLKPLLSSLRRIEDWEILLLHSQIGFLLCEVAFQS